MAGEFGLAPAHYAAENGQVEALEALREARAWFGVQGLGRFSVLLPSASLGSGYFRAMEHLL